MTAKEALYRTIESLSEDDFFAHKLPMSSQPFALDLSEVSGDDFIL